MTYKLGETIWTETFNGSNCFECEEVDVGGSYLTTGELIKMGAVKQESEQIELSNIDLKSKTDWQAHLILLENKLNEVIQWINKQ